MPRLLPAALLASLALAAGCGPKQRFTDEDIPKLTTLGDIMWSQAQVMDPLFKKIGAAGYSDEDYASFTTAGGRLRLTSARIKADFSKGPEFNTLADALGASGEKLVTASGAKDMAGASAALLTARDTCRGCHKQFR